MLRKYVFAGAGYSGKTTMLNEMAKLGFQTVPETGRQIIEEQLKGDNPILPWNNRRVFELLCLNIMLENETKYRDGIVFFDRALPDSLAYHKMYNACPECVRPAMNAKYDAIFLLEMLPGYAMDKVRHFDIEHVKQMHTLIAEAYTENGSRIMRLPAVSIEERVKIVLANI